MTSRFPRTVLHYGRVATFSLPWPRTFSWRRISHQGSVPTWYKWSVAPYHISSAWWHSVGISPLKLWHDCRECHIRASTILFYVLIGLMGLLFPLPTRPSLPQQTALASSIPATAMPCGCRQWMGTGSVGCKSWCPLMSMYALFRRGTLLVAEGARVCPRLTATNNLASVQQCYDNL